jgi:replicative DNA helicase
VTVTDDRPDEHVDERDLPPNDQRAEQAVLGSVLMSPVALAECAAVLRAQHFWRPAHGQIWSTCVALATDGIGVDPISVADRLGRAGELSRVGGPGYLHTLVAGVPTAANVGHYARLVVDAWARRQVLEVSTRLVQLAHLPGDLEAAEMLTRARSALEVDTTGLGRLPAIGANLDQIIAEAADEVDDAGTPPRLVPVGLSDLDNRLDGGLRGGNLIVVGARPAVGKSLILLDAARHTAVVRGLPVLFVSMEMSELELLQRLVAAHCRVRLTGLRTRSSTSEELVKIMTGQAAIEAAPLAIDDSGTTTISRIVSRARQTRAQYGGLALICVDYMQLITGETGRGRRDQTREQEVAAVSRGLKLLSKELDCPVMVASQFSRKASFRRPQLADLRESGAQEQDADVVLLMHREEDPIRAGEMGPEVDIDIAKNRHGPQSRVRAYVDGARARINNLASGVGA